MAPQLDSTKTSSKLFQMHTAKLRHLSQLLSLACEAVCVLFCLEISRIFFLKIVLKVDVTTSNSESCGCNLEILQGSDRHTGISRWSNWIEEHGNMEIQGWISDMDINGPTFVPKVAFFTNLGQGLSQKISFFLIFEQTVRLGFLDKMSALLNQKSTFVLVSSFFGRCIYTVLPKYYLKSCFSTKKASYTTIITIFNAKLH